MPTLEIYSCPRCSANSSIKHCDKSKKCKWRICTRCPGSAHQILVFFGQFYFITGK